MNETQVDRAGQQNDADVRKESWPEVVAKQQEVDTNDHDNHDDDEECGVFSQSSSSFNNFD